MTSDDLQKVRALIAYVQHKDDCDKWEWIPHEDQPDEWELRDDLLCSCGLSALLSRWEARHQEDETRVDGQPVNEGRPTAASNEVDR